MPFLMLSYGFRPLFLCMIAAGFVFVPWWTAIFFGALPYAGPFNPVMWHGHEMIFGFAGAAIGGFLLTAVANWTGRPPISGAPLALIVASWLAARFMFAIDTGLEPVGLMVIDSLYWLLLTFTMGREVLLARNTRNLKVVVILGGFVLLTLAFHGATVGGIDRDWQRTSLRGAIMLVGLLITLIGGRIVPAFTGNWLRLHRRGKPLPASFGIADTLTFVSTGLLAIAWTFAPERIETAWIALIAGTLQLVRVARWQGHQTLAEPLVFILHAGYAWLGIGFMLIGTGTFLPMTSSLGIHALGVGTIATMIMAVASRAAFGHTGRPLNAGICLSMSFVLIQAAAVIRVAAAYEPRLLIPSAVTWALAFLAFAVPVVAALVSRPRD